MVAGGPISCLRKLWRGLLFHRDHCALSTCQLHSCASLWAFFFGGGGLLLPQNDILRNRPHVYYKVVINYIHAPAHLRHCAFCELRPGASLSAIPEFLGCGGDRPPTAASGGRGVYLTHDHCVLHLISIDFTCAPACVPHCALYFYTALQAALCAQPLNHSRWF
jgi:hypothetical protein